jgi:hypothetical protein
MGHLETSAEFAHCMRDHFVLLGPGALKEGVVSRSAQHPHPEQIPEHVSSNHTDASDDLTEQPLRGTHLPVHPEEELMEEIRHQYHLDLFFKNILDTPRAFKNFTVENGIIRIKLNDQMVTCISDIKVQD